MRKTISILLTIAILLIPTVIIPASASDIPSDTPADAPTAPVGELICGDPDGDGEVTILDATAIQRHLADLSTTAYSEIAADADRDGEVTILDATAIQRHLANLPSDENIGKVIDEKRPDDEEDFSYLDNKSPCPACGSDNVAYIIYGYPLPDEFYSAAFRQKLENREIVFGGCVIGPDSPSWYCNDCGHGF